MKSPRRRSLLIISTSLSSGLFKLTSAASSASSSSRASSRLSTSSSSSKSSSSWLPSIRRNLVDRKYGTSRSAGVLRGGLSRRGGSSSSTNGGGDDLTKLLSHDAISSGSDTMNHRSNVSKNTSTSPTASSILSSLFSTDYNSFNQNGNSPKNLITYSSCSVRGTRPYMEDEYFISEEGRFAAVFDGHGGSAVSQYLRQNLYAYVQAALPSCVNSLMIDELLDGNRNDSSPKGENGNQNAQHENNTIDNNTKNKNHNHKIVQSIVEKALRTALSKVDHEVQGISHWSFQGSTALALLFYNNPYDEHDNCSKHSRYIATANIGDSRAVLSRNAHAIDLTQDHKPNSPSERRRIESLGGTVDWCGEVDSDGNPVKDMGVYRINGNLALSRAIGDRSERPWVTSEADVRHFLIEEGGADDDEYAAIPSGDEFVVMATDGLFDVFSSQDVVNFIHGVLEETALDTHEKRNETRKNMARTVVEEALRRGTFDNVTVLILWLNR